MEQVVLLSSSSVVMPDAEASSIAQRHAAVERALSESRLAWTFVRPGAFATNTLRWAESIRVSRTMRTAFPEASTVPIHERDLAAVAARALLDDAHCGHAYVLSGPQPLPQEQQVALIREALGAPVQVEVIDRRTQRAEMLRRASAPIVDTLLGLYAGSVGRPGRIDDGVPEMLCRAALDYGQGAQDDAEAFR